MATRQTQSRQSYGGSPLALENDARLAAIPTGGTTGQVLAKTSGTNYATGWSTPAGGSSGGMFWPWSSGRVCWAPVATLNSQFMASAATIFWPIRIPNACTVSQVGFSTSTAGLSFYIGLYLDAGPTVASRGPGARLFGGTGTSSSTAISYASSTNYTFTGPGNYWVAFSVSSTSAPVMGASGGPIRNFFAGTATEASTSMATIANAVCARSDSTYSSGANPGATDFSTTTMSLYQSGTTQLPLIFFNVT